MCQSRQNKPSNNSVWCGVPGLIPGTAKYFETELRKFTTTKKKSQDKIGIIVYFMNHEYSRMMI